MKEVRYPNAKPPIRFLAQDGLLVELYRVLCYFHASKSLSSSEDDINHIPATQLLAEEVQEAEIVAALVSSSIKIRLLDEQLWDAPQDVKDRFKFTAGQLWNPHDAASPKDLSVREACNKIVHASDIGFFVDDSKYRTESFLTPRYLEPKIAVYGKFGGNEWRAEVSIIPYIEAGYWLARHV